MARALLEGQQIDKYIILNLCFSDLEHDICIPQFSKQQILYVHLEFLNSIPFLPKLSRKLLQLGKFHLYKLCTKTGILFSCH